MSRLGPAGLIFSVCLILGLLGPLDPVPERIGMALGLALWAVGRLGHADDVCQRAGVLRRIGPLAAVVCGTLLLLSTESVEARLALATAMAMATPGPARLAETAFGAATLSWRLLWQGIPWLWMWEVEISRVLSRGVGAVTGQKLDFGPTASGLDLFVVFLLHAAAFRLAGGVLSWRRCAAATTVMLLFIAVLPVAAASPGVVPFDRAGLFNMAAEHLEPSADRLARVMFGWSAILFAVLSLIWLAGAQAPARFCRDAAGSPVGRWPMQAWGTWLSLTVLLVCGLAQAGWKPAARRSGEIVLLKGPAFDMSVPEPGRFGAGRAGMFGMLPRYLEMDGHRVRMHEGRLSAGALQGASILIVILPTALLDPPQLEAIETFVAGGGSLLALGDHTDLLGTMGPMNSLLAPWGIGLRFDSAYPAVREWRSCLEGAGVGRHDSTGIGTGASLQITGAARALLVGRYALSDAGDRSNTGRGAYLGNYSYDAGEQLSDLVLAATARHGRGQVAVFGDTSSFQNLMLPFSYPFVARLMDDLARPAERAGGLARWAAALAAALLGVLALAGSWLASGGLVTAVIALHLATSSAWTGRAPLERLPPDARLALIDAGHLNRFSLDFWRDESIGGLIVNLERDGYLPLVIDDGFAGRPIGGGSLPVLVAPQVPLAIGEAAALQSHLEAGGAVLVAAGAAQRSAVAPLLARYGVSIQTVPLGPVPVRPDLDRAGFEQARKEPLFREAYPVESEGGWPSAALYRAFDRDIVIRVNAGRRGGRLLVIGDPAFLTDRVLENENSAWEGNVTLLEHLLDGDDGT
jgi:hypothetical protein